MHFLRNKAGYTALGAPKHLYKRRRYGPTDGQTLLQRRFVAPKNRGGGLLHSASVSIILAWLLKANA